MHLFDAYKSPHEPAVNKIMFQQHLRSHFIFLLNDSDLQVSL